MIKEDTPLYGLTVRGAASLSNSALLSLIIGGNPTESLETAREIMTANSNSFANIARLSIHDLKRYKNMTQLRAVKVASVLEVGRRRNAEIDMSGDKLCTSSDIVRFIRSHIGDLPYEAFAVLYMNKANKVRHFEILSTGGIDCTIADPRLILKKAFEWEATTIVVSHNHPSGNLKPSRADDELTNKLKQACKWVDITLLDHVIVTQHGYYSFSDEGILSNYG